MVLNRTRSRTLWLAAAVILVAGCQSSGHQAPADPPDPRPLDGAVHFSADESTGLWEAEEAAVRACMSDRGHRYESGEPKDGRREAAANPYALLRPGWAESDGYGMTAELLAQSSSDPNKARLDGLTAKERSAWTLALLGDEERHRVLKLDDGTKITYDPESCVSVGQAAVYGDDWPELYHPTEAVSNAIIKATWKTAAFRKAEAEWASCMREQKYRHTSLRDPREEVQKLLTGERAAQEAGERELKIATADLECQLKTDLHEKVARAQEPVQRRYQGENSAELDRYDRAKQAALQRLTSTTG